MAAGRTHAVRSGSKRKYDYSRGHRFTKCFLRRISGESPQTAELVRLPLDSAPVLQFDNAPCRGRSPGRPHEHAGTGDAGHVRTRSTPASAAITSRSRLTSRWSGSRSRAAASAAPCFGLGVLQALHKLELFRAPRLRLHRVGRRLYRRLAPGRRWPTGGWPRHRARTARSRARSASFAPTATTSRRSWGCSAATPGRRSATACAT